MADRVYTGVVQFEGDDWPGVFIRGDTALHCASIIRNIIDDINAGKGVHPVALLSLKALMELLNSCDVSKKPKCQLVRRAVNR